MDPIVLVLAVVGYAVVSIIAKVMEQKKRREQAQRQTSIPHATEAEATSQWPQTAEEWQEQLRKLFQPETRPTEVYVPPKQELPRPAPVRKPVPRQQPMEPLHESIEGYGDASQLSKKIEQRLDAIDEQTRKHRPARVTSREGSRVAARAVAMVQNPNTIQQAYLASIILGPPKSIVEDSR